MGQDADELSGGANPADAMTALGRGGRPNASSHFEAVRIAIGAALRAHYSEVLREPLPERMVELLRQLDQATGRGQVSDNP